LDLDIENLDISFGHRIEYILPCLSAHEFSWGSLHVACVSVNRTVGSWRGVGQRNLKPGANPATVACFNWGFVPLLEQSMVIPILRGEDLFWFGRLVTLVFCYGISNLRKTEEPKKNMDQKMDNCMQRARMDGEIHPTIPNPNPNQFFISYKRYKLNE